MDSFSSDNCNCKDYLGDKHTNISWYANSNANASKVMNCWNLIADGQLNDLKKVKNTCLKSNRQCKREADKVTSIILSCYCDPTKTENAFRNYRRNRNRWSVSNRIIGWVRTLDRKKAESSIVFAGGIQAITDATNGGTGCAAGDPIKTQALQAREFLTSCPSTAADSCDKEKKLFPNLPFTEEELIECEKQMSIYHEDVEVNFLF